MWAGLPSLKTNRANPAIGRRESRRMVRVVFILFLLSPSHAEAEKARAEEHRAAARTLNERGVKTATGKPWSPVTVPRVWQRLDLI